MKNNWLKRLFIYVRLLQTIEFSWFLMVGFAIISDGRREDTQIALLRPYFYLKWSLYSILLDINYNIIKPIFFKVIFPENEKLFKDLV